MKLAFIVTEFPKVTETFIARDLVEFMRQGHEIRLFHLTRFRRSEVVHEFVRQLFPHARDLPYLLDVQVVSAFTRQLVGRPWVTTRLLIDLFRGFLRRPDLLVKSLAVLPKSIAAARELAEWGADHVHAEFAGHPATAAWMIRRVSGLSYSVSCRAHDIFKAQEFLATKLGEASAIRTISRFNVEFLRGAVDGLNERAIEVIHSSVDTASIPALPMHEAETLHALYVGSLQPRKGVEVLLEALAHAQDRLGEWRCEIIGTGPSETALKALASELSLSDRVEFLGPKPFEEVSAAYARATVVVVPSIVDTKRSTEGIPNVVIEALAHQRPVITTRVSGIPELVVDGETGWLVDPGDVGALARALSEIAQAPRAAWELAVAGRARVEREFDLATNARAQLALFRSARSADTPAG